MAQLKDSLITGDLRVTGTIYGKTDASTIVSGILPVARGGTGLGTFTANRLIYGNNTGALQIANHFSNASKIAVNSTSEPNYNFYVNGTSYHEGTTYVDGDLIFPVANKLDWNQGTYKQRLIITDDSNADTSVFTFQQSSNSGTSYLNLLDIRDNGRIILTPNTGGIYKYHGTAGDSPVIQVNSNNLDTSIIKIDGNNPTDVRESWSYGFNLKYIGTGGDEANSLDLIADNGGSTGTDVIGISVSNAGRVGIGSKYDASYRLKTENGDVLVNNGLLKIQKNSNIVTIGSQNTSFTHIYNSTNIPFIFNKDILVTDKNNLGNSSYPFGNIYLGTANGGIYYQGSKALGLMIKMLDNTGDAYGNGIRIGYGGTVVIGAGESGDNLISAKSLTGGTETLFLTSDGSTFIESGGDTIANRVGIEINSSGHIIPVKAEGANTNAQYLGSSSARWAKAYIGTADTYGGSAQPIYWNAGVPTPLSSTVGSATKPIYLQNGVIAVGSYELKATVNAGTANQVAYYSGANAISSKAPAWAAWTAGTTAGPQANIQIGNATYKSAAIPSAGAGASGIVTTGAQQFDGNKTFKGSILAQATNTYDIGTSSVRWNNVYAKTFTGNLTGSASGDMHFYAGTTAPTDTSGQTAWLDTTNKRLKFYWDGAWHAMNTYQ